MQNTLLNNLIWQAKQPVFASHDLSNTGMDICGTSNPVEYRKEDIDI